MLATESWNGHTFEVRCESANLRGVRVARLWVRADGGRFEFVEINLLTVANSEFARQHPGSRWLPLAEVPFRMRDGGTFVPCKAEFDVSLFPPLGSDKTYRYRIFVGDEQVAEGEIAAKSAGDVLIFHLVFGGFLVVFLGALWLFNAGA